MFYRITEYSFNLKCVMYAQPTPLSLSIIKLAACLYLYSPKDKDKL